MERTFRETIRAPGGGKMILNNLFSAKIWSKAFLLIQILCLLFALVAFVRLWDVVTNFGLSTPTCPEGIYTYMSAETIHKCSEEQVELYLPKWVIPLIRGVILGSVLNMVCGLCVWVVVRPQGDIIISGHYKQFVFVMCQFAVLIVTLALYLAFYPFGLHGLIRLLIHGTVYGW